MSTRNAALQILRVLIVAAFFCFGTTHVLAQEARIDPASPINGISYSLDDTRKFLVITVALRQLPTTAPADQGILLKDFKMGNLRSVSDAKLKSLSNTSDALNKLYKIEISDTPSEDVRLSTKWDKFSFVVMASYGETNRPYESPQFTIVRNIQVPTIKIGTPKWQAENAGNTVSKYLAVPVAPSESMRVNVVISDGTGPVAQKNNVVIGGSSTPTNVELDLITNRIIATGIKYTITVTTINEGSSLIQTSEWTPTNFIDNYRLSDTSERALSTLPAVETQKVKLPVDTLVPGNSLRLIPEGIGADRVKVLSHTTSHWEFELDLTGVTQKTVPFYFDGEGGAGQVFVGNDKRYFLSLNNDLRVVGALTISFNSENEMVVNYTLNRRVDGHRLRLVVPGILELTDLPAPVRVGDTNEYNVKAKTSVTQLISKLASELKNDAKKSFPIKFKLIESEASADKPFVEFAIYAYGLTTGDYLGKIAAISELVGTSSKLPPDEARKQVLQKLGLQTMPPAETTEAQTVEKLVTLLSTESNNDKRRKSFWAQLAGYAIKIIPPLVGIPVGL